MAGKLRVVSVLAVFGLMAGAMAVISASTPAFASSTTLYVSTTGSNTGNCQNEASPCATISYAVSQAASGDTIEVASGTYHDIVEVPAPLDITIEGPSGGATVDGESTTAQVGSVFAIDGDASVTLENLTISDGEGTTFGSLTYGDGVFVSAGGSATLTNDTLTNNTAFRGPSGDVGGGIYNSGTAVLNDDTVSDNNSSNGGGGIYTSADSSTTVTDSTVSGNLGNGEGGGIFNAGLAFLRDDTVAGNTAEYSELAVDTGGGIYGDEGTLHLDADTIANNTAPGPGDAVGTASGTTTDLAGTIFGQPVLSDTLCDVVSGSTWNDDGYNVSQDTSCALSSATSLSNTNADLGALAANGGPTETMLPATGSPAIDQIPNPTSADGFSLCPGTDQRGVTRPQGPKCDIGSVEVQETTTGPTIKKVSFVGGTTKPTITITGRAFGTEPNGTSDNSNDCGSYTNNGEDYGPSNLWFEDVGNFYAGQGTPPNAACVGLIVTKWTSTKVVMHFGNAYDTYDHWYITAGDKFVISLKGVEANGTIKFAK
ncbi:MAG TPA: choice-of-anchor Q domain-containing protein [Acidimicrobiales bacterium]|nr:choice-of-anchor Q domain-containing protein [Acidimicrobiales bacterium]